MIQSGGDHLFPVKERFFNIIHCWAEAFSGKENIKVYFKVCSIFNGKFIQPYIGAKWQSVSRPCGQQLGHQPNVLKTLHDCLVCVMFMEDEIPGVTTMPHQLNVVINIELGREGQPGELQGWRYGCRQDFLACVCGTFSEQK